MKTDEPLAKAPARGLQGLSTNQLARFREHIKEVDTWYSQIERNREREHPKGPAHRGIHGLRNIDDYTNEELATCCSLDELSVVVEDRGELPTVADRIRQAGYRPKRAVFDTIVVKLSDPDTGLLRSGFKALENLPGVRLVSPRHRGQLSSYPDDPYYSNGSQWNLFAINAPWAWDYPNVRSANTVLATIDTGCRCYGDLGPGVPGRDSSPTSSYWSSPWWSWMSYGTDTYDYNGHGTWVASVAAALTNNTYLMAGVGGSLRIMPMSVEEGKGSDVIYQDDVRAAVYWAVDNGARVLNLSLGYSSPIWFLEDMVQYAGSRGAVLVCSAGNNSGGAVLYPAAYANSHGNVAAVSGTAQGGAFYSGSSKGPQVTISAPGAGIPVLDGSTVTNKWGTSYSAPHVSGAMAAISGACSALPVSVVKWVQEVTAQDLGQAGRDDQFGFGLLNFGAAASWLLSSGVVFRWIDGFSRHAYTDNCNENKGGHYEGLAFGLRPAPEAKTLPLYRKYHPQSGARLLTTNYWEGSGFVYEGTIGYIGDLTGTAQGMPLKVYRLYNGYPAYDHLYTTSTYERSVLLSSGWYDEGVTGYAW